MREGRPPSARMMMVAIVVGWLLHYDGSVGVGGVGGGSEAEEGGETGCGATTVLLIPILYISQPLLSKL